MVPRVVIPFPAAPARVHKRTLRSDLQLLAPWLAGHGWLLVMIGSAVLAAAVGVRGEALAAATIQRCIP